MQDIKSFYQSKILVHKEALEKFKQVLFASSMLRLVIFCVAALVLYFFGGNTKLALAIVLLTIVAFLFLVSRHSNLQHKRDKTKALLKINETEIKVLNRDFHEMPAGDEFKDPLHFYSQDIDLFGRGSFFQYVNRAGLVQGAETLAKIFKENTIDAILRKQEAIAELSKMADWRQDFSATASLTKTETSTNKIVDWLHGYKPFIPKIMGWLPMVFSIASLSVFGLYFFDFLPESALILWLFIGVIISGAFFKKIMGLTGFASKIQSTFQQYNELLLQIEKHEFTAELLVAKKKQILNEGKKTSEIIKSFSNLLNSLDKNNNMLYVILANGFFLRSLTHVYHIEKWIATHGNSVQNWFETIAFFDAYNSLGNFAFNHPKYTFPKLTKENIVLQSQGAGHPLMDPEKCVLNDFKIDDEQFFIITGANMAGKSTFLRTVSLQIVMANIGLPVCAQQVVYNPIKLITSMRTTDSLTDDESYFFSELKRLKYIVDEIQTDKYFIILDEILKGTNSTDKAIGSRKFVERLVKSKSTGIIATHDLSLCEVANELPMIENHYFDAEIINNELHFDYKFKDGICKNMNASFLLKKMEIVE
ncbi:DNA mismatch repair protein MutS [Aurantibacter crassamenti]|uniref:MutS-related protein n=1 Tax=Aurantibacter crassamenti TaxID=1837375 RepID=UPI00193AA604|nr:DNA mismatch repair protein MutS [Aurantibacter crassamenti]MBM1105662.1 DNA mismatch repair protein MutS [Aurantibacter crassamenti]